MENKNIVIGVTSGIACYKIAALASKLGQTGANVQVLMTQAATKFIAPLTFQSLSGRPVVVDIWQPPSLSGLEKERNAWHIAIAEWADLFLIAPASANSIARFSAGFTDDAVSLVLSALPRTEQAKLTIPVMYAPAMNTSMWLNPANQRNIRFLNEEMGYELIEPDTGWQACKNTGKGRLAEPEAIFELLSTRLQDEK